MRRHPPAHADADGRDLRFADPDAGQPVAARGFDLPAGQRGDDDPFQRSQINVHVLAVPPQVDDRIADQLAGSVKGDFAPAADPVDRHAARVQQERFVRAAAQGEDRRVFEQEQAVRRGARLPQLDERPLPR